MRNCCFQGSFPLWSFLILSGRNTVQFLTIRRFPSLTWLESLSRVSSPVSWSNIRMQSLALASFAGPVYLVASTPLVWGSVTLTPLRSSTSSLPILFSSTESGVKSYLQWRGVRSDIGLLPGKSVSPNTMEHGLVFSIKTLANLQLVRATSKISAEFLCHLGTVIRQFYLSNFL